MNERVVVPERKFEPAIVAIATTTMYPKWYVGELRPGVDEVDKIRGDLAIETVTVATQFGYQVVVVDGGSSPDFNEQVETLGIKVLGQSRLGMSAGRQEAFEEASQLPGVEIICWTEPEKFSFVKDGVAEAVGPILNKEADVVIPKRDEAAFKTYPAYQAEYEQRANRVWNNVLRSSGYLTERENFDVWFGPRVFRNDPELLKLFLRNYSFKERGLKIDEVVKPDLWPNATFIPVVAALAEGYKVKSVGVTYEHPQAQTVIEQDSAVFRQKRDRQYKGIVLATIHYIRMLAGGKKSSLKRVTN